MSELKINTIKPLLESGTTIIGKSGDTITIPAGATIVNSGTQIGMGAVDVKKTSSIQYTGRATHDTTQTWYTIAGLNITHQASSVNNRLLFLGQMCGALNPGGSSFVYRFYDRTNSTYPTGSAGDTAGSRPRTNAGNYIDSTSHGSTCSMMAWVTPASTAAIQYGVDVMHQHTNWRSNGNYDNSDSTTVDRSRGLSTFQIIEIEAGVIQA